jgi:Zn-dependent protease
MNFNLQEVLQILGAFALVLISLSTHEAAHAFAAKLGGDDTAEREGRLTLNPLAHIDLFGTILLPILLKIIANVSFGWAKPVPVNPYKLRSPKWGYAIVSAAGPAANFLLATVTLLGLSLYDKFFGMTTLQENGFIFQMVISFMIINVFLAIFNLIPIHPLDGAAILTAFLPRKLAELYYRFIAPYGMLVVLALLYTGGLSWLSHLAHGFIAGMSYVIALII